MLLYFASKHRRVCCEESREESERSRRWRPLDKQLEKWTKIFPAMAKKVPSWNTEISLTGAQLSLEQTRCGCVKDLHLDRSQVYPLSLIVLLWQPCYDLECKNSFWSHVTPYLMSLYHLFASPLKASDENPRYLSKTTDTLVKYFSKNNESNWVKLLHKWKCKISSCRKYIFCVKKQT